MPSAVARRLFEDQIPSIMSVYQVDSGIADMDQSNAVTIVNPKLVMEDAKMDGASQQQQQQHQQQRIQPGTLPSESIQRHNHNTSTQTSESADSSPTTTLSTADSSDLSDPSPSSSPDSPVNLGQLPSFAPTSIGGLSGMARLTVSDPNRDRPMTSPGPRRLKNMKGLSIQPPSTSSALLSEPASPSFIKPKIPPMKRKPSQLSLKTNSTDLMARAPLEVLNSPTVAPILQRRALKHSTSTPQMLSGLRSTTFGPAGEMTIPTVLERNETGLSSFFRPSRPADDTGGGSLTIREESPIRTQIANRIPFDSEPYHEIENNEDLKSPGYPDGPIPIYGDNVYLYLEPTAEEAARFDVVINVAREVSNPFKTVSGHRQSLESKEGSAEELPTPDTAASTASFATAFEYLPENASGDTPSTPKAQPLREPEYIHIPWDHNTDISKDLMALCETIDKRTREGKKVLVHCQQGASRSASLIIAYGIYRNPELSVNDAYYAAQGKSRWISPNMKLMYCLQDFQKEIAKRRLGPGAGSKGRSGRSPSHRATMSADNIDVPSKEPLTAPLPADGPASSSASRDKSPNRARVNSTPNRGEPISPGPSSAPSSFSWSEKEDESDPGKYGRFNLDALPAPKPAELAPAPALSISRTPPSPGPGGFALSKPPPSPRLGSFSLSNPPSSPGLGGFTISPARSPSPKPASLSPPKQPPSLKLAPPELSRPPMSPGLPPSDPFSKPPHSPGFGAHRFGSKKAALGLASLRLAAPPKAAVAKEPPAPERPVAVAPSFPEDEALMSPRAETMTNNPLHPSLSELTGMQFVEVPSTPREGLFSPLETVFPRDRPFQPFGRPTHIADPRSPPTKGEAPIVRSIDEML
ncbi:hypothetical protein VTH06DRAFT_3789 [Thermothelomyces fergusii]